MDESIADTETVADLSNRYVDIRNEREEKREVFEGEDKVYSDENTTSMSTEKYTVIKRVTKRYNPTNWDAVYRLVDKYKAYGVLHKRVHDTNMKDFLEQHPDEYPEGLNVDSRYAVTVKRKPSL